MARDDPEFRLRLPLALHNRLKAWAKASGRSVNSEIVQRLIESFPDDQSGNISPYTQQPPNNDPLVEARRLYLEMKRLIERHEARETLKPDTK